MERPHLELVPAAMPARNAVKRPRRRSSPLRSRRRLATLALLGAKLEAHPSRRGHPQGHRLRSLCGCPQAMLRYKTPRVGRTEPNLVEPNPSSVEPSADSAEPSSDLVEPSSKLVEPNKCWSKRARVRTHRAWIWSNGARTCSKRTKCCRTETRSN